MIEGALILILGMIIGGITVYFYYNHKPQAYSKYKNTDGLYSRKAVKERSKG